MIILGLTDMDIFFQKNNLLKILLSIVRYP